jgi:mRNA-degrading endonuclease toxin of MazEF toxin-antitoxin module
VKRGDLYWADLVPRSGSEQTGRRPVIIVSHDGFNQTPGWRSIIVVPVSTSASQARRGATVVDIPGGVAGLPTSRDDTRSGEAHQEVGTLPPELLRVVGEGLSAALDLE